MNNGRFRRRPSLERMEPRLAMSIASPMATVGVTQGTVPGPGGLGSASVVVEPLNLAQGRSSTVIELVVTPSSGGTLNPSIMSVFGPSGKRLSVYDQGSLGTQPGRPATIFVLDDRPGPLTVNVAGRNHSFGPFQLSVKLPGDVNGSGHVDLADLQDLTGSYLAKVGDPNYNPAADFLQTGVISQADVRILERNLPNPTPNAPLSLNLQLAPGEALAHPRTYDSGAITLKEQITVLGRTMPNSAVFVDGPQGYYKFNGPLLATDAQGRFSYTLKVANAPGLGLVSNLIDPALSFLVVAPNGRQLIRNYPILRIN